MNSADVEQSSLNRCQTCLGDPLEVITLESLSKSDDMLSALTYCNVKIITGLSNSICGKCVRTFQTMISFKNQCVVSQTILEGVYKKTLTSHSNKEQTSNVDQIKVECIDINYIKVENTGYDQSIKNEIEKESENFHETNSVSSFEETEENKESHLESINNSISCDKCALKCNTKEELVNHCQNKHDTVCNICNKTFVRNRNLRLHLVTHQKDRPRFYCKICKKFYDLKRTYSLHVKTFHSSTNREKTVCTLCGVSVYGIAEHMRTKHAESDSRFTCSYCNRTFKQQSSCRWHVSVYHENPEKYSSVCPECGKVFRTLGEMRRHLNLTHSDARNYNCRHCDKTFKFVSHRSKHEKFVHLNEVHHRCEICLKGFYDKTRLDNHVRTHTGEKPFVCEICARAFTIKVTLNTHMKLVHAVEKSEKTPCLDKIK